jgi:threonine/homoserine/homoserine lactone efflux protein
VNELVAFVGFAVVGTGSPGPNNAVLWASGMRFGFRRTVPHVLGTAIGMSILVVAVAAGVGALLEAVPAAEVVLKIVGSVYLLWIALLVLRGGGVGRAEVDAPFSLWRGVTFQLANPKAWVFSIAAVGTFLPPELPWLVATGLLVGVLAVIVVATASVWAVGGAALGRILDDERSRRTVSVVLAMLLVASVVLLWV